MSAPITTVFIVDDDPSVCRSLSRLMRHAGHEVRTYASAEDFLQVQSKPLRHPTCLVVDLHMPGLSGLELQSALATAPARCPAIFISGNGDIPSTVQAMKQGAVTFLAKPFDTNDLLRAVAEALEKHRAELTADSHVHAIELRMNELTDREREIMAWVITGALNKQIGAELDIVEKTVKVHRSRMLEKMQATSVADLVRLCAAVGFAPAK